MRRRYEEEENKEEEIEERDEKEGDSIMICLWSFSSFGLPSSPLENTYEKNRQKANSNNISHTGNMIREGIY